MVWKCCATLLWERAKIMLGVQNILLHLLAINRDAYLCISSKRKDEALGKFKMFEEIAECQTGKRIIGIVSWQCHTRPQQNGVAERVNRIIVETARSMLLKSGWENTLWAEAIAMVVADFQPKCLRKWHHMKHLLVWNQTSNIIEFLVKQLWVWTRHVIRCFPLTANVYRIYDVEKRAVVENVMWVPEWGTMLAQKAAKLLFHDQLRRL